MKKLQFIILALLSTIIFTSCPGGGDEPTKPDVDPEKEYSETRSVAATGCDETVTFHMLKASITSVSAVPSWMSITPLSYTSGAPSVQIVVQENTSTSARNHTAEIKTANGDKLKLTIVQAGKEPIKTGIDDVHNNTSTKPAYTPRK